MSSLTGTPESTRVQTGCMHGEFGLYPQTGACTSHSRSRLTLYLVPSIMSVVRIHKRAHSRATHATGVCQGTDNDSGVPVTKPTWHHVAFGKRSLLAFFHAKFSSRVNMHLEASLIFRPTPHTKIFGLIPCKFPSPVSVHVTMHQGLCRFMSRCSTKA